MRIGTGIYVVLALVFVIPLGVSAQDTLEEVRFSVERYEIVGDNPIGEIADSILAPYTGEQYGLEGLSAARDALEQAIIDAGFNFHRVSLPPQDLFEGSVILRISRFAIGRILVEGNQFFDDESPTTTLPRVRCCVSAKARPPTLSTRCWR
jgi:hemolysin activation/secretion protein